METHEFDIEIRSNGEVKIHMKGVKGKSCLNYKTFLEQIIGPTKEVQHTSEFYEPDTEVSLGLEEQQQAGQGGG